MALEKDKERPTSPMQRLSSKKSQINGYGSFAQITDSEQNNLNNDFQTFEQSDRNITYEHRNTYSQYSESPMMVGRDMSGYDNKNVSNHNFS